jgi:large subunit ribosomal protein L6
VSRIGKLPISIPKGVVVKVNNNEVSVKGPKGLLTQNLPTGITMEEIDNTLVLNRSSESKKHRAFHGMARANIANLVKGVTEGFTKTLSIIGVGYRAELKGKYIIFALGYSHPIYYVVPKDVEVAVEERGLKIILKSIDKIKLGQAASEIRAFRPPEPYKGKGIRYINEKVRRKEGKAKG